VKNSLKCRFGFSQFLIPAFVLVNAPQRLYMVCCVFHPKYSK